MFKSHIRYLLKCSLGMALLIGTANSAVAAEGDSGNTNLNPKIAWYGQLSDGLAEAKRSRRPILLVSAAPQCQNVSGMW